MRRRSARRPGADARAISTTPASRSVRKMSSARRASSNLPGARLVVVEDERADVADDVAAAADHVDEHRRGELQLRRERLGLGGDEPLVGALAPGDLPGGRLLAHDLLELLRVVARLADGGLVLDLVLGREHDDGARGVVAGATGPPGDLVELAGAELPHPLPVELRERGDEHRADRHVDADAERVGAADDPQQPALRERLDEPAVARQHAGVVHADARAHEPRERLAEARREAESADRLGDLVALLARDHPDRGQGLRPLHRGGLREVHDVHRRLAGLEELLDGLVHGRLRVGEVQRHRALDAGHSGGLAAGAAGEVLGDRGDVAEGRRHEDELRARQGEERHLPRPAPVGIAVVVELVHHDLVDRGIRALAEGEVGEDLGRAADDRGIGVHRAVAGDHADVLRRRRSRRAGRTSR